MIGDGLGEKKGENRRWVMGDGKRRSWNCSSLLPITYDLFSSVFSLSSDNPFQEDVMKAERLREIIRALMSSRFYFDLDIRERYDLVVHVLRTMEARSGL